MAARLLETASGLLPDGGAGAAEIRPGDAGLLVVRASWEGDARVSFPTREQLEKALQGKAHVLDDGAEAPADAAPLHGTVGASAQAARAWRVQVLLPPGDHDLPEIPVRLEDADGGQLEQADVPGPAVRVATVLAAEEAQAIEQVQADPQAMRAEVAQRLAPARGPWLLVPQVPLWAWLLLGLALLALAAWLVRRALRRRGQQPAAPVPLEPAEVVARRRLRELREGTLLMTGRSLEFHVALADILKEYLERRLQVDLREQTTDEVRRLFHGSLKSMPNVPAIRQEVLTLLGACDLVKFARFVPVPSEALALIDAAERVVTQTTEAAPAPAAGAPGSGPGPTSPDASPSTGRAAA